MSSNKASVLVTLLAITFIIFVPIRTNFLKLNYGLMHHGGDEVHTFVTAVRQFFGKKPHTFRAPEGIRTVIKMGIPFGLYKACSLAGGRIFLGKNCVEDVRSQEALDTGNPIVRDFSFGIRIFLALFFFVCFAFFIFSLWESGFSVVAFFSLFVIGFNPNLLFEQQFAYIEPSLAALLFLAAGHFIRTMKKTAISNIDIAILGMILGFSLNIKITGLFYCLMAVTMIMASDKRNNQPVVTRAMIFASSLVIVTLLINFNLWFLDGHFHHSLDGFFWNFWHYAQASDVLPGFTHFQKHLRDFEDLFGAATYYLPFVLMIGIVLGSTFERKILLTFSGISILTLAAIVGGRIYWPRNIIVLFPVLVPAFFMSLQIIILNSIRFAQKYMQTRFPIKFLGSTLIASGLGLALIPSYVLEPEIFLHDYKKPVNYYSYFFSKPEHRIVDLITNMQESNKWKKVAVVGAPESVINQLKELVEVIEVDSFPRTKLDSYDYDLIWAEYIKTLTKYNGVPFLVNRVESNFHITNFIFPFRKWENLQIGEYFLFYGGFAGAESEDEIEKLTKIGESLRKEKAKKKRTPTI